MRITLLCSDLSQNALSRAWLLAEVLAPDHEVRIVGSTFGEGIWPPAAGGRIPLHAVPGVRWPGYAASVRQILRRIDADLVYAVKPLVSSLGVALVHRARTGCPVLLDVDDDELAFRPAPPWRAPGRVLADLAHPNGHWWSAAALRRARRADAVTVATLGLQAEFGGVLVPHVRDTDRVRPRPHLTAESRRLLGVAPGERVVMFAGTPRPHKGIEDVARALPRMRNPARLVVLGAHPDDPYVRGLREKHPAILLRPPYRLDELPLLLQGADAVVVAQRLQPESARQLPAKLLDAMAMAKPVVATAIADNPSILAEGRGMLVPPGDAGAVAAALDTVLDDPVEAARMGERAREWCVRHGSYHSARPALRAALEAACRHAGRHRLTHSQQS